MLIATHTRATPRPRGRTRRGTMSVPLLVVYSVLLIVMLWASQQLSFRSNARVELQNADDAAAHAAARALVSESAFARPYVSGTNKVDIRTTLISSARADARRFARLNRVMGRPLVLRDNPDNLLDGEIYVGTLSANPTARTFGPATSFFDPYNPDLNVVRIKENSPRSRVRSSSTYYVDRDVVGFRLKPPPGSSTTFPSVPMVPFAILTDPCLPADNTLACWQGKAASTWEGAIMARKGVDNYLMDSTGKPAYSPGAGDGIPEITVTLTEKDASGDNAQVVYFDETKVGSVATLLLQIQNGVVYGDLPANNGQAAGQFLLNAQDSVPPPPSGTTPATANQAMPATGALPKDAAALLVNGDPSQPTPTTGLKGILGKPRVWMLYSGVPSGGKNPTVSVVGFVVARVMSVTASGGAVTITLQPSVLVTDKAVTDWALRSLGPRTLYNPYIARLRFVE
jgi:hypothetical protein